MNPTWTAQTLRCLWESIDYLLSRGLDSEGLEVEAEQLASNLEDWLAEAELGGSETSEGGDLDIDREAGLEEQLAVLWHEYITPDPWGRLTPFEPEQTRERLLRDITQRIMHHAVWAHGGPWIERELNEEEALAACQDAYESRHQRRRRTLHKRKREGHDEQSKSVPGGSQQSAFVGRAARVVTED